MDELSMKFNKMIMEEMGFEVGAHQRLYDQDNGMLLQFEGKDLVAPGTFSSRETTEFDPYNSTKLMAQMFTYYTNKLAESGESEEYNVLYNVDSGPNRGRMELKNDNGKLISGIYQRDQCKYADLMLQLNGDENPDLKEFDIPKLKPNIKKRKTPVKKKRKE